MNETIELIAGIAISILALLILIITLVVLYKTLKKVIQDVESPEKEEPEKTEVSEVDLYVQIKNLLLDKIKLQNELIEKRTEVGFLRAEVNHLKSRCKELEENFLP